jgi:hypothetical protein
MRREFANAKDPTAISQREVMITRAVSRTELNQMPKGALWLFRQARRAAKGLAREQLRTVQVHMKTIRIKWDAMGQVAVVSMAFEPTQPHRYRPVGYCFDCDRRWGQHAVWEKQPRLRIMSQP